MLRKPICVRCISSILFGVTTLSCFSQAGASPIPEDQRQLSLPDSIYMTLSDDSSLDLDRDGLKDDYENRLADAWRPYFIFDEHENDREKCHEVITGTETVIDAACVTTACIVAGGVGCALSWVREQFEDGCKVTHNIVSPVCKQNVHDDSLQPFEPVAVFQVRPQSGIEWPRRIKVQYAFLYRLDGGYRGSNVCTNYHYGDTQSGSLELMSDDGVKWVIDKLDLWSGGSRDATSAEIEWTAPRSTYWGKMDLKPSPKIYASAGKHHQYITAQACEDEPGLCDDDCGGGVERWVNLTPKGNFINVGEKANHPSPFIDDLGPLGYPNEYVWHASYHCSCEQVLYDDHEGECFTGGMGAAWTASTTQKCNVVEPVYTLFDNSNPPELPSEMGAALMSVILM